MFKYKILFCPDNSYSHKRLDYVISQIFYNYPRTFWQKVIANNKVFINNLLINNNSYKIPQNCQIKIINFDEILQKHNTSIGKLWLIPKSNSHIFSNLNIKYIDKEFIIINKPINLITHPGIKTNNFTLINYLIAFFPELTKLPRCGLLHRLDKNTSGLMIFARTLVAYNKLKQDFLNHNIQRYYLAIVYGNNIKLNYGEIKNYIHKKNNQPNLMEITFNSKIGKLAITTYQVIGSYNIDNINYKLLKLKLYTGRTHQIRLHLQYIKAPILGEQTYTNHYYKNNLYEKLNLQHQALHSYRINFYHPINNRFLNFSQTIPQDFAQALDFLRTKTYK